MATRGPRPEHPNLTVLKGNPGRRRIKEMPKLPPSPEDPPDWLATPDGVGKHRQAEVEIRLALWRAHVPTLLASEMMSVVDRETFAGACKAWALYRSPDPALSLTQKLAAYHAALRIFQNFGLTPLDRVRLAVRGKPKKKDTPGTKWGNL